MISNEAQMKRLTEKKAIAYVNWIGYNLLSRQTFQIFKEVLSMGNCVKKNYYLKFWRNTLVVQSYLRNDLKNGKNIGKRKFFPNSCTKIVFGWDAHREQVLPSGVLPKLRFFLNLIFIQNLLKLFKTHPN